MLESPIQSVLHLPEEYSLANLESDNKIMKAVHKCSQIYKSGNTFILL